MFLAIVVGFAFILAGYKPIAKGLILGTFFSIINFVLMGEMIPWRIGTTKKAATAVSAGSIVLRYAVLAVAIFIGLRSAEFNLPAVVIGVFMIQIMLLGEQITKLATSSFKKQG